MQSSTYILFILLFSLISCSTKKGQTDYIVVSIEPQRYFLEQIIKDKYKIQSLIPAGANPENYDPTPSQMILLNNSKLYFKLGYLGIENILLNKITNKDALVVDTSSKIEILKFDSERDQDDDDHHSDINGHSVGDPHFWTSTANAKIILSNMLSGMILYDSIHADFYRNNYEIAIQKVDSIEKTISNTLSSSDSKAFIIYHPALSYYAKENNLKQFSMEYEGKSPSPIQLKSIVDSGLVNNVKIVFIQKEFDIKNAETIANQIKADTCSIDLLSYDWPATMLRITNKIAQ